MIGIKVSLDTGTQTIRGTNAWDFSDYEQIDSKFVPYIYKDKLMDGDRGSNIERAFGNIQIF